MWGTASPKQLVKKAKQLGYDRLALTDTDNLYGLWPFLKTCKEEGISPIVGAELTEPDSNLRTVCLVENTEGYKNLCRLITLRHTDKKFRLKTALLSHAGGLSVLTRSTALLAELHQTGVRIMGTVPRKPDAASLALKKTAGSLGVPLVATPGSFFLDPEDYELHRLLRAIDLNTSLFRLSRKDTAPTDAWLAKPSVYEKRFDIWPETLAASEDLARRLAFTGPGQALVMPPFTPDETNRSPGTRLRDAAYEGARLRYGNDLSETIVDRLEYELAVIEQMKFSTYFLVVKDIVKQSPRICGRGSGAASLVSYALGITNVCPVKHNLYFERFLNPGRKDPPDIDVDFAWDERDDVIAFVLNAHKGHAAMVCNHVAFKPRMAVRETAKVYGLTDREIGRISKRLPWFWRMDVEDTDLLSHIRELPKFAGCDFPPPWPDIMALARGLIGLPRHISVHPGGIIITPSPITDYVPMETAPKGVPVIQWEKDGAEEGGLVKIDLLGNRSLGVIRDATRNIKENGIFFDEKKWAPENDPATQKSIAEGKTMGCFYIESPAMRLLQQKTGKGDFEHLVIHSSIIRPAANEFIREYVRRLHGNKWEPIHPLLSDVLEETYGIMVYQEDVSKTAVALAGFSHADADGLRKIMSKKDKHRRLNDYREQFTTGAGNNGVSETEIKKIWDMMMSFSGYSFCKPHSASYAKVSFQAAFLKTHFPAEFMAAVISNQGGFYSTFAYVSEAKRLGVNILPPDVNDSGIRWKGKNREIRVGLLSVKQLNTDTRGRMIAERQKTSFKGMEDFFQRISPDEREAASLIHAGALDSLDPVASRADLLWQIALHRKKRPKSRTEYSLFDIRPELHKPVFPPENERQRLRYEFGALGFLCNRHPMELYFQSLSGRNIVKAGHIHRFKGRHIRMAGLLITGKVIHTRNGEPMEFLTFEDETGLVETVFFPDAYQRFCAFIDKTRPFILEGRVEEDFGAHTLTVNAVRPL